MEEANVFVPRRALRFAELWLDDQKRWIAVARKNNQVISLHGPVVRQVKNVVRRADHQRIEMVLLQHLPHALPLLFVDGIAQDRKSTRLNSSHGYISYAVFCLKK